MVKNLPAMQDTQVRPLGWSGRSPGEGNGFPLQHSCLENPMDGGGLAGYKESQRVSEQLKLSLSLSTDLSTSPSPATCQLGELGQQSPAPWASVYLSMK